MISCHGFCRSARRPSIPIAVTKMTYGTSAFGYSWWKGQAFEATQSPRRMGTKDVAGDVEGKGKGNEDLDNSLQNRFYVAVEVEPYENGGERAMEERETCSG
ncbi:uncharacterized protein LOC126703676 isoform X2 [Quercus robur]|uniref:uncharacterized protein LOC126703676 isoform X2 n=1 Tax=Quercus robur TaxID=38942 RepID=UPI002162F685|nr:uncharacterized protein LOC126703676 isoform X2 [Quercus robur]